MGISKEIPCKSSIGKSMITSHIYETCPFMVSRKIKLQWNVLKIDIGVRFQSYKDYILPYISIKFRVAVAKSSSYAVVKTARESKQLKWTYGR